MAALKEKASQQSSVSYRKGERSEAPRYQFSYIPHIVIADGDGNKLYDFDAKKVIAAHKDKKLAEKVLKKAKSFL